MARTLLPLALLLGTVLPAEATASAVAFRSESFEQACDLARQEKQVVFVDFFTIWCGPCKQLDATTWRDKRVGAWLGEQAIALKIDAEEQGELAKRYGVDAYPTLLFLQPDGAALGRMVGFVDAERFLAQAPEALRGITELDRVEQQLTEDPSNPMLRQKRGVAPATSASGSITPTWDSTTRRTPARWRSAC